jgi:hypothetical protein
MVERRARQPFLALIARDLVEHDNVIVFAVYVKTFSVIAYAVVVRCSIRSRDTWYWVVGIWPVFLNAAPANMQSPALGDGNVQVLPYFD